MAQIAAFHTEPLTLLEGQEPIFPSLLCPGPSQQVQSGLRLQVDPWLDVINLVL